MRGNGSQLRQRPSDCDNRPMPSNPLSLYYDLCRNRTHATALQSLLSLALDEVRDVSETVDDPLAVSVFLRAARGTPAQERVELIAEAVLENLGLRNVLDPEDIVNTRAPSMVAAESLASSAGG